jgi:hypothetical protein
MKKTLLMLLAAQLLIGCATPTVVAARKAGDSTLTCDQLKAEFAEAIDFEEKARKERGMTGNNVAAAIFFPLAMVGTFANIEEATAAAKLRQANIEKIAEQKKCNLF